MLELRSLGSSGTLTTGRDDIVQKVAAVSACLQSFHDYYSRNHARLLAVWRTVVGFRRQFSETRSSTERDLAQQRAEMSRVACDVQSACVAFSNTLCNDDAQRQVRQV